MGARLIAFGSLGLIVLAAILVCTYVVASRREKKPEMDISVRRSRWRAHSSTVQEGTYTEVGIVRVDMNSAEVLERRVLQTLRNDVEDYPLRFQVAWRRALKMAANMNIAETRR